MEKQISMRGYVTYALTNGKDVIYGMVNDHWINDWSHEGVLYWSQVYCEPNFVTIIRTGTRLVGAF